MDHLLDLARRAFVGSEERLARRAQRQGALAGMRDQRDFERELMTPSRPRVLLGRAQRLDGAHEWVALPRDQFLGRFWNWTGATGSGKSMAVLGILLQLLVDNAPPIVVLDAKGELSAMLRTEILPWLVQGQGGEQLLPGLRIIRPFDRDFVPNLRITAAEPHVSTRIQALGIATSLAEAVGDELGHRMHRVFVSLVAVAIERKEALPQIVEWLRSPATFALAARSTQDAELRGYALREFPTENKESIRALRARLSDLLFVPQVRACFETPTCVSFPEALESGITLIDACDPPGGIHRAKRLIESLVIGRLTRAILSRPISATSQSTLIVLEEFQEAVRAHEVENFGRLLAQSRYKKICLSFVNQQASQLDPALRKLLRTNCSGEVAFRCSREDAESLSYALPIDPAAKSPAAARAAVVRDLTRLPQRHCLLWLKDRSFGARIIRSPRLDLSALRIDAPLSPDLRDRIGRGIAATPRMVDPHVFDVGETPTVSGVAVSRPTARPRGEFPELG